MEFRKCSLYQGTSEHIAGLATSLAPSLCGSLPSELTYGMVALAVAAREFHANLEIGDALSGN